MVYGQIEKASPFYAVQKVENELRPHIMTKLRHFYGGF